MLSRRQVVNVIHCIEHIIIHTNEPTATEIINRAELRLSLISNDNQFDAAAAIVFGLQLSQNARVTNRIGHYCFLVVGAAAN